MKCEKCGEFEEQEICEVCGKRVCMLCLKRMTEKDTLKTYCKECYDAKHGL